MSSIKVDNISKRYIISPSIGDYLVLRDKLSSGFFGLLNKRAGKEEYWALKNVSFYIKEGEVLGVIGHNGAGKSTLLKILSRVTPPSSGKATIQGRVASLLEIGTGFHPELSGRENIYLNGIILGMKKKEIKKLLEEIIDFSGVEKFIDTPVKRYSSGMYVRLAFAVGAFLSADVLLVDEILSVGDIDFQKKCQNKISSIASHSGKTIILISHNLETVNRICNQCALFEKGEVKSLDKPQKVIEKYLNQTEKYLKAGLEQRSENKKTSKIRFSKIEVENEKGGQEISSGDRVKIILSYSSESKNLWDNVRVGITLNNSMDYPLVRFDTELTHRKFNSIKGSGKIICLTDRLNLGAGRYSLDISLRWKGIIQDYLKNAIFFQVNSNDAFYSFSSSYNPKTDNVLIPHKFINID
jgi:lipopolysaccharide transport system ATP-binding protein